MTLELVDDLRYSILELNAHAMQRSQTGALAEAQQLLETAYIRLQSADAAVLAADAGLIDQLKATTLANLGVVECHKKELDKSLDHLEAALAIEKRVGIFSPTTALNLCATFNALGRFEEAVDICSGAIQALMATNNGIPNDDNKTLWAAAWHNLSVAEMNLGGDFGGTDERRVAVLNMFRNAMRASVDLLGPKHPLTATIHESYRAARPMLKKQGAYKVRDSFLPMLSNSTTQQSEDRRRHLCTQTLTDDEKLGSVPAYRGALSGNTGRTNIDAAASRRVPSLLNAVRKAQRGDCFRPTQTLVRAQPLYLSHHPATTAAPRQSELLLQPRQREARNIRVPSICSPRNKLQRQASTSPPKRVLKLNNKPQPQQAQTARISHSNANSGNNGASNNNNNQLRKSSRSPPRGGGSFNPATHKVLSSLAGGGAGGSGSGGGGNEITSWAASNNTAKQRSIEQALIGDMWVEVEIPLARRNSPPHGAHRGAGGVPVLRQPGGSPPGWGGSYGTGEFRAPAYAQTMHVIEPSDPIMERVTQPSSYATLDSPSSQPHHADMMAGGGMFAASYQHQHAAPPLYAPPVPLGVPHPQGHNNKKAAVGDSNILNYPQANTMAMNLAMMPNAAAAPLVQQQQQQQPQQAKQQQQVVYQQPPISALHQQEQQLLQQHQHHGGGAFTPAGASTTQQQQQQHQASSPPIPQPPKRPASSGTRGAVNPVPRPASDGGNNRPATPKQQALALAPQQQQHQQPSNVGGAFTIFSDALGSDIGKYPGLQMLSQL